MANKFDVLVAAKAMGKEISKRIKEAEDEVKKEFMEDYRKNGNDRRRSTVFDPKAAYMTLTGGKPSEHVTRFQVVDVQKVYDWMDEVKPETDSFATDNVAQFAEWWFNHTGECPDGCTVVSYDTEPTDPSPRFVVKEDKVLLALEENPNILREANQLLLGDGDD